MFFVPNLGVKATKNRNVRSLCAPGTSHAISRRCPSMDHIAGTLRVAVSVLAPRLRPVHSRVSIREASPYCGQIDAIFRCCQTNHDPKKNYRQCHIFYKSQLLPSQNLSSD